MAIRQRGKDTWEITVTIGTDPVTGKEIRHYETFKGGKRQAEARERAIKREIESGEYVKASNETLKSRTLYDYKAQIGKK